MRDFLSFEPLYQERVWGGRALEQALGRTLPAGRPIGESWEIVDRPEAQSVVKDGPYRGVTLRQLIRDHAAEMMGPAWNPERSFPLLVKWLDCRERLSLQVHPPAAVAPQLGGEPKTENWYIADAAPGAQLIVGLTPGTRPSEFEAAIGTGTLEKWVRRFPVARGDSILVHSGEVHAIDAGNLILEIQQNSDTTYRVYDWGRLGLDGKPRQMHVRESMESIRWDGEPLLPVRAARERAIIADCREFRIERVPLAAGERLQLPAGVEPSLVSVVEGQAGSWRRGANVVVPYGASVDLSAAEASVVLLTTRFARA
ncbi:MAG TPA: type I phosphomannose isomerase catalytic subunit [Opitutaceae bacterium]